MVWGQNIATCLHCGTQWVVGDCIPSICPECEKRGHEGVPTNCRKCRRVLEEMVKEMKDRMDGEEVSGDEVMTSPFDAGIYD